MAKLQFSFPGFLLLALGCVIEAPIAQQDFDDVQIGSTKVAEGVYMLTGRGGNIGVSAGDDGVFLIDDQFAPLTEKITAAVAAITPKAVKFVLNTHWHSDHVGGNENFGRAGALIVAHDNVRKRMSAEQFVEAFGSKVPASADDALPVVTFSHEVSFHVNGDEIHVFHVPSAHTDGDVVIYLRKANVVHMGDLFFNGRYPFIDLSSGGSVDGVIAAADRVMKLITDDTKIMPGHGVIGDRKALKAFRDMLVTVKGNIKAMVQSGKTLEQVMNAGPSKEFDETWGKGFMKPADFVKIVYSSLKKSR